MVKVNERWAVPHYRLMAEECRITHTAVQQPGISHLAEGGYIVSVNSLEVSNDNPCPNELVTITANTSPPDGNIAWNVGPGPNGSFDMENGLPAFSDLGIDSNGEVILPLNVVDAIGDTITLVGSSGENHTITATHGNPATTLSQTIQWRLSEISIELSPGPYIISQAPKMPAVSVSVSSAGGSASGLAVDATVGLSRFDDCPPHGPINLDTVVEVPIGSGGNIDFGDVVRGGSLSVSASATVNGCPVSASTGGGIHGTNPPQADIRAALPHRTLRAIACKESGLRQFDAAPNGGTAFCPLFHSCDRVGVMGIKDPDGDEVWNWRRNVESGIRSFDQVVLEARQYPNDVRRSPEFETLVRQFNDIRFGEGLRDIRVELPDFDEGDFTEDFRELELDAIRGYNGWCGDDRFGFELHEFQVAVDDRLGQPVLRVTEIDESALQGKATWERVPSLLRPMDDGCCERDYVNRVLAHLDVCADGAIGPGGPCAITVIASAKARNFTPPDGTGEEEFSARIRPDFQLPGNSEIRWRLDNQPDQTGTVSATPGSASNSMVLASTITAVHPNQASLVAEVVVGGQALCSRTVALSVPQFFHVTFPDLQFDLTPFGLTFPNPDSFVIPLHNAVAAAVQAEIFRILDFHFGDFNVRFTTIDPAPTVGPDNVTTVDVSGSIGGTDREFGISGLDPNNVLGIGTIKVFPGEFANRRHELLFEPPPPQYLKIFDGFAVEDTGSFQGLPGKPVGKELTDWVIGPIDPNHPNASRQFQARAAVLAAGRLIGNTIAHEAGHALGLAHNVLDHPHLMERGDDRTFRDRTGIVDFDPMTGRLALVPPPSFRQDDRLKLTFILGLVP